MGIRIFCHSIFLIIKNKNKIRICTFKIYTFNFCIGVGIFPAYKNQQFLHLIFHRYNFNFRNIFYNRKQI